MATKKDIESKLYWMCMDMAENLTEEDVECLDAGDVTTETEYATAMRKVFEAYVTLADISPDTYSGDNLEADLWDAFPCKSAISQDDFFLWLWDTLC